MLLLALVVGTMSCEDTVGPSGVMVEGVYRIPLLRTYNEPVVCPSTVHRRNVPFPEQLNENVERQFSNVV